VRILVTGANGFVAKNLIAHLEAKGITNYLRYTRKDSLDTLRKYIHSSDLVYHLAATNRAEDESAFVDDNVELSSFIAEEIKVSTHPIKLIVSSSIQAEQNNIYGQSKLRMEEIFHSALADTEHTLVIYRLKNIFGKWCKPHYNSVVSTFCYNILNNHPISVNDPTTTLNLIYIDDLVKNFLQHIEIPLDEFGLNDIHFYTLTLGDLADILQNFQTNPVLGGVGEGLTRSLYATYLSFKQPDQFSYYLESHEDERGAFVEMLKTQTSGQFSYFTAKPGITRGGHYHHTKSEKFLVLSGKAEFKFRHMNENTTHSLITNGNSPQIVETIPGWAHDISNIGSTDLIVILWANEIFQPDNPDTFPARLI
jgi:UDP-2-acetamido-2,6-beta-L-arabino-hexul-4-ose reductase